jgi:hypothetical protein
LEIGPVQVEPPEQIDAWNAVTYIDGKSNDGVKAKGWYTEMVVDLAYWDMTQQK